MKSEQIKKPLSAMAALDVKQRYRSYISDFVLLDIRLYLRCGSTTSCPILASTSFRSRVVTFEEVDVTFIAVIHNVCCYSV